MTKTVSEFGLSLCAKCSKRFVGCSVIYYKDNNSSGKGSVYLSGITMLDSSVVLATDHDYDSISGKCFPRPVKSSWVETEKVVRNVISGYMPISLV
jgi:hypothetical protein